MNLLVSLLPPTCRRKFKRVEGVSIVKRSVMKRESLNALADRIKGVRGCAAEVGTNGAGAAIEEIRRI
jgi:hypothetical protein